LDGRRAFDASPTTAARVADGLPGLLRAPVLEGGTGSARAGALELRVVSALRAESGGATRVLTTRVAVRNRGRDTLRVAFGDCAVAVALFPTAVRAGAPAWSPGGTRTCRLHLIEALVPPGAAVDPLLAEETPLAPLTASLLRPAAVAPGRYHLAAAVTLGVGRPPTGPAVAAAPEQRVRVPVGTLRVGY
jgi:hypothetical protein